jgi:hypothetical protein
MFILPIVAWHHNDRLNSRLDLNINVVVQTVNHASPPSIAGRLLWLAGSTARGSSISHAIDRRFVMMGDQSKGIMVRIADSQYDKLQKRPRCSGVSSRRECINIDVSITTALRIVVENVLRGLILTRQ